MAYQPTSGITLEMNGQRFDVRELTIKPMDCLLYFCGRPYKQAKIGPVEGSLRCDDLPIKAVFNDSCFSITVSEYVDGWVFPEDRFVEYGPEDEWWAKKVGFGHRGTVKKESIIPKAVFTGSNRDGSVDFEVVSEMQYA